MLRLGWRAQLDYGLAGDGVRFDPGTLMVTSMAATAVGGGLSAASTLAGGGYAKEAGRLQKQALYSKATQIDQNATQALASEQRKMFDTQEKTRLTVSAARAAGGASGVDVGTGSAATVQGEIAQRGSYHALMDMFNGESARTGLHNQAEATRYEGELAEYEGEAKESASELAAAGTLASTAGSMASTYGGFRYPQYGRRS